MFKPESPAYYYVIEIQNKLGDAIMYKGGITDDITERFNAHKRKFSTYLEERSLKLESGVIEVIPIVRSTEEFPEHLLHRFYRRNFLANYLLTIPPVLE